MLLGLILNVNNFMVLGLKFGKFWLVVGGRGWEIFAGCGWLWVVVADFGWFWLVVGRCGSFWLDVGGFGSFLVLVCTSVMKKDIKSPGLHYGWHLQI